MRTKKRIFRIKIQNKETGKEDFIIMGDNYKLFEDHLVSWFASKWIYDDSPEGKGRCLGRELKFRFLEIYEAKERFVSFGGLKMAYEENYDKEVEEHNQKGNYGPCKYLRHIQFLKKSQDYLTQLLKNCRVKEEEQIGVAV